MPKNKRAYALFKKGKLVGCYYAKSKATHIVDEHLGTGLFSPKWEDNKKADYEIVPCEVSYDKVYALPRKGLPRLFASLDDILNLLKEGGVTVKKKKANSKRFTIETDRGPLKGEIIQVK